MEATAKQVHQQKAPAIDHNAELGDDGILADIDMQPVTDSGLLCEDMTYDINQILVTHLSMLVLMDQSKNTANARSAHEFLCNHLILYSLNSTYYTTKGQCIIVNEMTTLC
jgi:hypothetical protein